MSIPWRACYWLPGNNLNAMDCSTYSIDVCNSFTQLTTIVNQVHHASLGSPTNLDNKENEDTQTQDKKRTIYVDETGCSSVISGDNFNPEPDLTSVQMNADYPGQIMNEEYPFCDTKKSGFQQIYENPGEASSKDSSMPKLERIDHCNMPASSLKQRKKYAKELSNSPVMPILEKQTCSEIDVALKCKTRAKRMRYCPKSTPRAIESKCFTSSKKHSDVKSLRKRNTSVNSSTSEKDTNLKQCSVKVMEFNSLPFLKYADDKIGKEYVLVERLDLATIKSYVHMKDKKCMVTLGRTKMTKLLNYRKCKNLQRNSQLSADQSDSCEETVSRNKRKKTAGCGNSLNKCSIKPLSQKPQPCNFCNSEQSRHCIAKYAKNLEITPMKKKQRKSKQKVKKPDLFGPQKESIQNNNKESCRINNYSFRNLRSTSKPMNSNNVDAAVPCKKVIPASSTVSSQSRDYILNRNNVVRDQASLSSRKVKKGYKIQHTGVNVTSKLNCRASSSNKKQNYLTVKENSEGKLSDTARELLKMCKKVSIQLCKLEHISNSTSVSNSVTNIKNISSVPITNATVMPQVRCETDVDASHLKNNGGKDEKSLVGSVTVDCTGNTEDVDIHSNMQLGDMELSVAVQPVLEAAKSVSDNGAETSIAARQIHTEYEVRQPWVIKSPIAPEEMGSVAQTPSSNSCSLDDVVNSVSISCDAVDSGWHVSETSGQSTAQNQFSWCAGSANTDMVNSNNCDSTEVPNKSVVHFNNGAMNNVNLREETLTTNANYVLSNEASWDLPVTNYQNFARTEVVVHSAYSTNHSNHKSLNSHTSCVPPPWKLIQYCNENPTVCFQKDNLNPSGGEFNDSLQHVHTCNLTSFAQSDMSVTNYNTALFNSLPNMFSGYPHQNYVNIDPYFECIDSAYNMHSLCLQDGTSASNRALNFHAKQTPVNSDSFNRDFGNNAIVSSTSSHPSHEDQTPYSHMEDQDLYSLEFDHLFGDIITPAASDDGDDNHGSGADFASNTPVNTIGNMDTSTSLNIFEGIDDGLLYHNAAGSTNESLNIQETFLEGEESERLSEIISYLKESSL